MKVALRSGGQVLLGAGVAAGQPVAAVSGTFVRDGDRVTPMDAAGG